MKFAQFKTFRDSKNKLIVSYWTMNKGEMFITCDLSKTGIKVDNDDQIEDYGCTFLIQGRCTCKLVNGDEVIEVKAGEYSNRRRREGIIITALEDNTRWCYSLHFDSLFTTDDAKGLDWDCPNTPKVLEGEQIKISAGETINFVDNEKDVYIVNPIYDSEIKALSYKSNNDENFNNLNYGKYLKIAKGKTFEIKSTMDIYIPKLHYINK